MNTIFPICEALVRTEDIGNYTDNINALKTEALLNNEGLHITYTADHRVNNNYKMESDNITKKNTHANRGMKLEKIIEDKCNEYIKNDIAYIYKLPTDFTVIRKGAHIVSAFPKKKSTIDFMGSYKGLAIAIETKSTDNKTSFPFSNIADHQWDFFKKWTQQAKGYYIVWFKVLDKMFLVKSEDMQSAKDTLDRKSAPLDWFEDNGIELNNGDFIEYID